MDEVRYRAAERQFWGSLAVTPTERRLRLTRLDVTVRVQEVGVGPAAVFVHGANTSGISWAALAARLTGLRCILVDRPGTGLSEPLPAGLDAHSLPAFGDALVVDVLDALDLPTASVVATSFGGYIALRSAAAHADRVDRMVLFSWSAGTPVARLPALMRLMSAPVLGRVAAAMPQNERSVRMAFRGIGHGPSLEAGRITREDLDCYLALLRHTDTMRNELALGRALISPRRGLNRLLLPDSTLAAIRAPTLLVWGENDPFGGANEARRLVARLPISELVLVNDAGHAPWLDDLEGCASAVKSFLAPGGE